MALLIIMCGEHVNVTFWYFIFCATENKVQGITQQTNEKRYHMSFRITMTSHERHVVSNHRSLDCLFNSLCAPTSKRHQSPHYWPFVRGIHRWPVNSPHKGPVTRKKLPFDDVIMVCTISATQNSLYLYHSMCTRQALADFPMFPCIRYHFIHIFIVKGWSNSA